MCSSDLVFAIPIVSSKNPPKLGLISRLCSRESPLLPTAVGLILSIAGAYGMLALVNEQNFVIDWIFFGAVLGTGLYILKRTFSVDY